jgi:hypothetical protein
LSLRRPQNLFSQHTPYADAARGQALAMDTAFLTLGKTLIAASVCSNEECASLQ